MTSDKSITDIERKLNLPPAYAHNICINWAAQHPINVQILDDTITPIQYGDMQKQDNPAHHIATMKVSVTIKNPSDYEEQCEANKKLSKLEDEFYELINRRCDDLHQIEVNHNHSHNFITSKEIFQIIQVTQTNYED